MKRWLIVPVALVIGILALWWTRLEVRSRTGGGGTESPRVVAPDELVPPEPLIAPIAAPVSAEAPRAPLETPAHSPALEPTLAEIRGRFRFEDGSLAPGVWCEVHGWGANEERRMKYGEPGDWIDPTGESRADGSFSLRFDPPRAFQFTLEARLAGFAGVEWRWSEIAPESVVDVGEVLLRRGGIVEGRIVDGEGNSVLGEEWLVYARSLERDAGKGRDATQVIAPVDPNTGRYEAVDVLPGRVELSANSPMANWIEGPEVTLGSGERLTVDIVYAGPDNSRRITVTTFSQPFYVMSDPEPEHIKLTCPDGEVRAAEPIAGSSQSFSFDDLEPGVYALEIDDPRYLPWSAAVRPGVDVEAHLQGSSVLMLEVVDEEGRALDEFDTRVEFRNVNFSPNEFEVLALFGRLEGMFPGDYTLHVRAGERLGAMEVDGLQPGETRRVRVSVGAGRIVSGRVQHRDGTPVVGQDVRLVRPAQLEDSPASPIQTKDMRVSGDGASRFRQEVESVPSDGDGGFRFAVARAGSYVVHASADGSEACSEVFELASSGIEELVLVLPHGGRVRGRLRGPNGETCAGFRVSLEPEPPPDADPESWRRRRFHSMAIHSKANEHGRAEVAADGRFELGPVPAGSVIAYLQLPEKRIQLGRGTFLSGMSGSRVELGRLTVEEEAVVERDFELAEFPGTLRLEVRVNGEPAPGLRVQAAGKEGSGLHASGETDEHGLFGPEHLFAATWTVTVSDHEQGWSHESPIPLAVLPSRETCATIDVAVATARVRFVDRKTKQPLAGRKVALCADDFPVPLGRPRDTDAEGSASFTLSPGEYRFLLDPRGLESLMSEEGEPERRTATVTWTGTGPLVEQLEL